MKKNYQEIYEETNNIEEDQRGGGGVKYGYNPGYQETREYYHKEYPSGYEQSRIIKREINEKSPQNNNQAHRGEYYNYCIESPNLPYNINQKEIERITNKKFNTPDRLRNPNIIFNERNLNNNLRDDYSYAYPSNNRINIRKKVISGSQTIQPYEQPNEDYIDNYQYHETKNIKNQGIQKYESITHIVGYSNLIPLKRMQNLYGNRSVNNYQINEGEPKIKNTIEKVQQLQRGKKEYDEFMNKLNSNSEQNYRIGKYRDEQLRQEELKLEKIRQERMREEEELRLEKIKKEKIRNERMRQEEELREEKLRQEKIRLAKKRQERIRQERINEEKNKKFNKIPNYNNNYNTSFAKKVVKTNVYKRRNNRSQGDKKYYSKKGNYSPRDYSPNINKNKLVSLIKVKEKTASLNYPNQNKKVDTYGENFDEKKYRRDYFNVENVEDGRIENHVETGLSKDGQYLISVTSAQKIYDERNRNENEYEDEYDNVNENINNERDYYEKEEINEEYNNNNNNDNVPEKEVEEIISTVTIKKKNLGDNYKFYESKNLYKPNITSFTTHRRRKERTIYGNEEHETREVKNYKIPQNYEFRDENDNYIEEGEGEGGRQAGEEYEEEENYEEEEGYY